jgi:chitinase
MMFTAGAEDLGGTPSDKEHFSLLTEELSEVFAPRGWILSAAVSPSRFRLEDAYDVQRLARNLDFINLMTFDMHAERDRSADHHAPLLQRKHDKGLNVFYNVVSIKRWCTFIGHIDLHSETSDDRQFVIYSGSECHS